MQESVHAKTVHKSEVTACVHKGGGFHSLDTSIRPQTAEVQQKLTKEVMNQKQCMLLLQQELTQVRQRNSEREYGFMNAADDKAFRLKQRHHSMPQADTVDAPSSKNGCQPVAT